MRLLKAHFGALIRPWALQSRGCLAIDLVMCIVMTWSASPSIESPQEQGVVHRRPGSADGREGSTEADCLAGSVALQHHGRHGIQGWRPRLQQGWPLHGGCMLIMGMYDATAWGQAALILNSHAACRIWCNHEIL